MRSAPVALALCLSAPALAAPTGLSINPDEDGAAYEARYSQGIALRARLTDGDGAPVAGQRVSFYLQRGDDEATEFLVQDPVTDAEGYATARLTLVNGRYGGQTFPAAAPTPDVAGERYQVRVSYLGEPGATDCDVDAGSDDGGSSPLCPSEAVGELFVALETTTLVIEPGNEVRLGETVDLIATLTDANGDAQPAGTDVDGNAPRPLAGRMVSFYYDVDGNARPSADERLGSAETNDQGVAVFEFLADPAFVRAQNEEGGVHAQFGGDDHYALSGAQQAIVVSPADPDATRTILEVTPEELLADGFSTVQVRATLVDPYNNPLGPDAEPYDVSFTTTHGTLQGAAERDPITGQYSQTLKAPNVGADATVQVLVDDAPGTSATVRFLDPGCGCQGAGDAAPLSLLALFTLAWPFARRRRSRG